MFEDPKEPKDQPDEVELDEDEDEDAPEEDESTETEAEPEDEAEPEGDEDPAEEEEPEEDDLPSDPKVLKRMLRQQQIQLERTHGIAEQALRRQPPTEEGQPDELAQTFEDLAKRDPAAAKLVSHLKAEIDEIRGQTVRTTKDAAAMAKVKPQHQEHVKAIMDKFGLPAVVAHQIYKGALYDQAIARRDAKKAKPARTQEPETTRPQGKAPLTRPVRRAPDSGNGVGTLVVEGLKLKTKYKPGEYATLMDSLPPAKRKVVLALRSDKKISVG